jgi:hypothetical protein
MVTPYRYRHEHRPRRSPLDAILAPPAKLTMIEAATELLGFLPGEIEAVSVTPSLTEHCYEIKVDVVGTEWQPTFEITQLEMVGDMSDGDLALMRVLVDGGLEPYTAELDKLIAHVAAQTRIPPHYLGIAS